MDPNMLRMMMGIEPRQRNPDDPDPNQQFYFGEIESRPDGDLVDDIHAKWWHDVDRLEYHHGYIQWLFPVFEAAGMNFESEPLTKEGAKAIRENEAASRRVLKSYQLMLHFYGFTLADERTGAVERDPAVFEAQINNFNMSMHNFLRISRIITSLGELGFHRYKKPFLEALAAEVACGKLGNAAQSLHSFWAPLVEQEDSPGYAQKTRETAEDRVEGCLFQPGGALAGDARPPAGWLGAGWPPAAATLMTNPVAEPSPR